jgi:AcrR family transcriptional regulator
VGRKYIPELETRIISVTISVGGKASANVDFSTKEIAKSCGVSEFTLFQRFGSKEELISRCNVAICNEAYSYFHAWVYEEKDSLTVFTARVLDYFLSHPEKTLFLINYSAATSQLYNDQNAFARYQDYILMHRDLLTPYFGARNDTEAFLLWSSYFRRLLLDAQFVLSGLYQDVATYREMSVKVALEGLRGFVFNPE